MTAAYVLLNTSPGTLPQVADEIMNVEGIRSIDAVAGPYDAIAFGEAGTNHEMANIVVAKIQKIPGVTKTLTCFVVDLKAKELAA